MSPHSYRRLDIKKYSAFLAEADVSVEEEQEAHEAPCMPTQVISNDEDDDDNEENVHEEDEVVHKKEPESSASGDEETSPNTTTFDLDDKGGKNAPAIVEDEEDRL